jgi:divalent metal cation (Fe/Co/Zn/Cd) transporter
MKYVLLPVKAVGFVVGVALLGAGIPLAWVWIASKLSHTFLKLPLLPLFVMVVGLLITYMALAAVVARFDKERAAMGPARMSWNRAMTDTRHGGPQLTQWERIFVTTAVLVAIAFEIWFFLFAGSSLPGSGT